MKTINFAGIVPVVDIAFKVTAVGAGAIRKAGAEVITTSGKRCALRELADLWVWSARVPGSRDVASEGLGGCR